ncbi:EAL domain-containing protein [Pantoea ananatis]|uniref:EAL domain-containing protein n=1 Tax=Pantoea ananas TaxID=553 RepID=UPI001C88FE4D|nr:EAL domain-containing protein [Pantoea ananatis]QZE31378.1 EAL domain-containing protein [Pantoea ananatis]
MLIKNRNRSATDKENNIVRTRPEDFVITACPYAARGISELLAGSSGRCRIILSGRKDASVDLESFTASRDSRVVVYLSDDPAEMLSTLHALARLCRLSWYPLLVLILNPCRADWLYRTLIGLTSRNGGELKGLRIAPSNISVRTLLWMLESWRRAPLLEEQAEGMEALTGIRVHGLSARELETVMRVLYGESVLMQSQLLGLSCKTLHAQHRSGMRKLMEGFPQLARKLPGRYLPASSQTPATADMPLSSLELDFEQGVHQGAVFVVFQPVTDSRLQVQGFELLIRWYRNGREMQPGEFLPRLRSPRSWMLLTAFVINEAVKHINLTDGAWYFAVNIPACMAESSSLTRIVSAARRRLCNARHVRCLVFEFSETTDFTRGQSMKSAQQLLRAGHRVLLDDCFSSSSVLFPVRQLQFSGYKLDMSVVSNFMHNRHDASLIQVLLNYCRLTDAMCIAEGVDSQEKLAALAEAGVKSFQGYYISRPVLGEALEETVNMLNARQAARDVD